MSQGRLLFAALPPSHVREAMVGALEKSGLDERLGKLRVDADHLHQSLSMAYPDSDDIETAMRRAGAMVQARSVRMILNRVSSSAAADHQIHWAFRAQGRPAGFYELLAAVASALRAQGLPSQSGHTPHVTVSCRAPAPLRALRIPEIDWRIEDIVLLRGGGQAHRYELLHSWPLQAPERAFPKQMKLLN